MTLKILGMDLISLDKFAYIRSNKCGSSTILHHFPDIIVYQGQIRKNHPTVRGIGAWSTKIKRKPGDKFPITAQVAREELGKDWFLWSSVRNPYSRAVSLYKNKTSGMAFYDFISRLYNDEFDGNIAWHGLPVTNYLCDSEGNLIVDNVVRVENLKEDINNMLIGLGKQPIEKMKHKNKTNHPDYWEMYKEDILIEMVSEIYATDIERWGYCF